MIQTKSTDKKLTDSLLGVIQERFSPRSFSPEPLNQDSVRKIILAASFAPSSFNEQPWRYRVFVNGNEDHSQLLDMLAPPNREWAKNAPVLLVGYYKKTFTMTGEQNYFGLYDLGQSVAYLSLQAQSMGLYTHQMGGFSRKKVNEVFTLGNDYEAAVVIAVGRIDENLISELTTETVNSRRKRKSIDEIIIK